MAEVRLKSVSVTAADQTRILSDLSFDVADGELLVLVGRSGAGKSSIIRTIAGLDSPDSGSVWFDDADVTDVPVSERDVGMVFQETAALFPKFTARSNISFGLRLRKTKEATVRDRVAAEARALGITAILERWPRELSAGHQQLVQIARAMVRVPKVLLLDEPMAYVDSPTRARLRRDLRELQEGYGLTTILATNDAEEAMAMADRIAVIKDGQLVQIGEPRVLYSQPADVNVATFTGAISLINAVVESDSSGYWLSGPGFRLRAWSPSLEAFSGRHVTIGVRPDSVQLRSNSEIGAVLEGHSYDSGAPASIGRLGESILTMPHVEQPLGTEVPLSIASFVVFDSEGTLIAAGG